MALANITNNILTDSGTSLSSLATQTYVTTAISNLVASAPATLDTLNELAIALGNDANFATTVATSIGTKQPQLSGTGFIKIIGTTISYDNSTYQPLLTNPVTGTGNASYLLKFTGTSTIGNSAIYDNSGKILIGTVNLTSGHNLTVYSATETAQFRAAGAAPAILFTNTDTNTNSYSGYVGIVTSANNFMAGSTAGDMVVQNYSGYRILFGVGNVIKMQLAASGQLILSSTISNGTYTYTLPSATGTLALTSQIPSFATYVPYTGATANIDLGNFNITASGTSSFNAVTLTSNLWLKNTGTYDFVISNGASLTTNTVRVYYTTSDELRFYGKNTAGVSVVPKIMVGDGTTFTQLLPLTGGTLTGALSVNGGTVNLATYTSSEARIADSSIHLMKTSAAGIFEAVRAMNADTTAGTTVRLVAAATSDPFNNTNGGKVFIDAVRTATNMDLVFSLNDVAGAAPVERVRFTGGGNLIATGTISASNYSGTHSGSSSGTNTGDQTNISGNAATASNASALGGYTQDFQTVVGTGDYLIIRNQAANKLSLASWASVQSGLGLGSLAYSSATIPTNTNQLTNGAGYITSSGSISGNAATATTATTANNLAANTSPTIQILNFTGVGTNSGNANQNYAIYQEGGAWSPPFPDLCIGYHTGIKIGAYFGYNGTRFFNNSDFATQTFSVNDGDNHVRVAYNLYVGGTISGSNLSGTNTGDQTNISGNATYATNSTRLYASDAPYTYGGAAPYYMYMTYDGGSYWELKVSPATPGTVKVAYANSAGSASSASSAGYAGYLSTTYAGGQQTNPQVYFNNGIGLKVAMTGAWSVWSDTLWINGYTSGDVPNMCALHFLRNGTPRMAISTQSFSSTSYGTYYEVITAYNIASQSVSYATSETLATITARGASTSTSITAADFYTAGWFRNSTALSGLYNSAYDTHFYASGTGQWNFATSNNSWIQIALRPASHQSTVRGYLYADTSNNVGLLTYDGNWGFRVDASKNAFVYGTDLTVGTSTSSNIYMTDTDETTRRIHCNSNRIGFLNSANAWGAWNDNAGNWTTDFSMYASSGYFYGSGSIRLGDMWGGAGLYRPSGAMVFGTESSNDWIFSNGAVTKAYISAPTGTLYAQGGITDTGFSRILTPKGGYYQTTASSVTGAIKITQPFLGGAQMSKMTVKIYEYSTGKSFTITVCGHRDGNSWYNVAAYQYGDTAANDITVRFGHDGTYNCIWIGEVGQVWSYPQVFITDIQNGYGSVNSVWNGNWTISFVGAFNTVMTSRVAKANASRDGTGASGTWGINVTGTAGSAPNGSNINNYYDTTAGNGYGFRFWNGSDNYKISMGASALYYYGPVTDYSIKTQMNDGDTGRGFTWGRISYAPIAALNSTSGNMQIAGTMASAGGTMTGQLNMFEGAYTGTIRFGSTAYWSCGISQRDAANAEMRIWAKGGASGSIYFATGYDGELAAATLPTDGMALKNNNLGIGGFTNTEFPVSKLHVKGRITVQNGNDSATLYGPNATWGASLYVGAAGNNVAGQTAQVIATDGNLHLDAGTASKAIYLNYYSGMQTYIFGGLNMQNTSISNANYVTSNTYVRAGTNVYTDANYGYGLVGVYSSTVFQGIFAMGDAYKLTAGGGINNLYGLAWSHPNAGGQAGYIATHGLLVMENGSTNSAISNGIWTRGDVTAYSDARVKENVEVITNAIERIKAIRGVTFTRNDREDKTTRFAGVIAQEVLAVLPEVVTEDSLGTYSVAYGNLAGLFIEAIKEQQKEIDELKSLINGFTK